MSDCDAGGGSQLVALQLEMERSAAYTRMSDPDPVLLDSKIQPGSPRQRDFTLSKHLSSDGSPKMIATQRSSQSQRNGRSLVSKRSTNHIRLGSTSDGRLLPTNIPGVNAEATAAEPKPNSLVYRLLHTHGADMATLERDAEEEPEGRQYAREGRPFLMMRPAESALADFSNEMPDVENSQFVKQHHERIHNDGASSDDSSGNSDEDDVSVIGVPRIGHSVSQRVRIETNRILRKLSLRKDDKKKKRKRGKGGGVCGVLYGYRFHLLIMFTSFAVAGTMYAFQGGSLTITEDVPQFIFVALPGLLSVLYLLCTLFEFFLLWIAERLLATTPWKVRNVIKVLHFHLRVITMFIIADVATNIWLAEYRNTPGALYLRGTFRSVYAVSICVVVKRIVIGASIHSLARSHYSRRVKQIIRAEDYLEMVASTGCAPAVRQRLKERRRLGDSSWHSYGYPERVRRLTQQALMLPYVRTQDEDGDEVAYYFSPDMIIEVNTVRGMRVLAYVLFDTLVQHAQYFAGVNENTTNSFSSLGSSTAADTHANSSCGSDDNEEDIVAVDSLTFEQWNLCFNDRAQAQRARKVIFTPQQLSSWRENKSERVIRRQDFVHACVGLFIKRQLLSSEVTNFNKLSAVISALISRLLVIVLVFVLAACFEVDVRELVVSAGAFLLVVSFALGSSISRGVESIVFVFGTYAYSIGDRVVIGPKDTAKAAYVQSVDLLTTTFRQITGEVFIMSNADLARERIFNLRRSANAVVVLAFVVSFDTTWTAIDHLKNFIIHYLEKHTPSWKPGADLYINALQRTESMAIEFWIESVHSWQSAAIVGLAQTKLLRQVRLKMVDLNIQWKPTTQTLRVQLTKDEPGFVSPLDDESTSTPASSPRRMQRRISRMST